MRRISLSKDTIQRCISDMSEDVKDQVVMKVFPMFSFQADESTDVLSCLFL